MPAQANNVHLTNPSNSTLKPPRVRAVAKAVLSPVADRFVSGS